MCCTVSGPSVLHNKKIEQVSPDDDGSFVGRPQGLGFWGISLFCELAEGRDKFTIIELLCSAVAGCWVQQVKTYSAYLYTIQNKLTISTTRVTITNINKTGSIYEIFSFGVSKGRNVHMYNSSKSQFCLLHFKTKLSTSNNVHITTGKVGPPYWFLLTNQVTHAVHC